jgi:arylsulfatase A-like enzyme
MLKYTLFLVALLVPTLYAQSSNTSTARPNVLFIAVDDLRPELGCYGKDYMKTPNIDALSKTGMVFEHAYCQQAVCSPSRSSLLTGTRPDTTQVWDLFTHFRTALPNVVTVQQNFMNQGYFVQGMGKIFHGGYNDPASWTVPWVTPAAPIYVAAESLRVSPLKTEAEPDDTVKQTMDKEHPKKKKKKALASDEDGPGTRGPAFEHANVPDNTYQDGKVADLAIETLNQLKNKKEPFFLAVGFIKPHLPWVAPQKYWDMYDESKIALAPNPFLAKDSPSYAVNPNDGEIRHYHGIPASGPFSDDLARQLKHAYYAGVSYTDAQVGRVMAELDRLGLRDNTIVVLWGDHGWKLGEHSGWGKHTNVENDTNAPLILSAPNMKAKGTHSTALVEFVDIYPTLSDLAGLSIPSTVEGLSFKPLLDNPNLPWKKAAFSQYPRATGKTGAGALMGYSMRTARYRFTVWVARKDHSKVDAIELYDHETDPQENVNIANLPENKALVADLMLEWKAGWRSAMPQS